MAIKSMFQSASPYIVGVGIPVAVLLAGAAFPIAYDLKGTAGEIKATLALMQTGNQRAFDEVDKKLEAMSKQLETLVSRSRDSETDPSTLLARAGMSPSKGFGYAFVQGGFYIFPQTQEAKAALTRTGKYRLHELTPTISGYVQDGTAAVPANVTVPSPPPRP